MDGTGREEFDDQLDEQMMNEGCPNVSPQNRDPMPNGEFKAAAIAGNPDDPRSVALARERLEQHPHFRCCACKLTIEPHEDGSIIVTGRLPSFYLKHLLHEILKNLPAVGSIINDVDVVCSSGLSSVQQPKASNT